MARFICADVFDGLAQLDDDSVDLVFTSPPFLALRSYLPPDHPDKTREIGSEATPADFLDTMLDVVEALDRVLAPHGSICFELGDTYSGSGGAGGDWSDSPATTKARVTGGSNGGPPRRATNGDWPLAKSLCGIPTLFAWSLAYGRNLLRPERETDRWRIRNLVVWARPNPPVGALGDKWRPSTSFVVVATKNPKRWFDLDAVRTEHRRDPSTISLKHGANPLAERNHNHDRDEFANSGNPAGAPPLDHIILPPGGYKGSHYAVFPAELPGPFIDSMCPRRVCVTCGEPSRREVERARTLDGEVTEGLAPLGHDTARRRPNGEPGNWRYGSTVLSDEWSDCGCDDWRTGVVLDPFAGSGTTLAVATGMGRDAIGIDLDERNLELVRERVGMFLDESGSRHAVNVETGGGVL